MTLPTFTIRQLLEAGVHFGHHTRRWNPKMAPYLFGERNGIHIIDLQQTVPMLHRALQAARDVVAAGGRVLFVGSKRQASERIAEGAKRCGQYYVNHRWLGGMLTNWQTISQSIRRLREMDERLADENIGLTKKELLHLTRGRDKLDRALGGIKDMGGLPDILFVIDTLKEAIAVKEANKLGIPLIAVVDSNSDPEGVTYPIPGNDDAMRSVELYCRLMADAVLDGLQEEMIAAGADIGEAEEAPAEPLPKEEGAAEEAVAEAGARPATEPAGEGAPVAEAAPGVGGRPAEEAKAAESAVPVEERPKEAAAAEAVEVGPQAEAVAAPEAGAMPAAEAGRREAVPREEAEPAEVPAASGEETKAAEEPKPSKGHGAKAEKKPARRARKPRAAEKKAGAEAKGSRAKAREKKSEKQEGGTNAGKGGG